MSAFFIIKIRHVPDFQIRILHWGVVIDWGSSVTHDYGDSLDFLEI